MVSIVLTFLQFGNPNSETRFRFNLFAKRTLHDACSYRLEYFISNRLDDDFPAQQLCNSLLLCHLQYKMNSIHLMARAEERDC